MEKDTCWIWHPDWVEKPTSSSAGGFVHFRKSLNLDRIPNGPIRINITADTRYKLYINSRFVHAGPVKGDQQAWFYDTLDILPHLRVGKNEFVVHVHMLHSQWARHPIRPANNGPSCAQDNRHLALYTVGR